MNIYADASVLVPLFTRDAFSARADAFIEAARPVMVLSDFAAAEFASAIARKTRTRDLTEAEARATFSLFDSWAAAQAARVQVAPADMSAAEAFVRRLDLNLRTPDAVNIAIALRLGADLATFDARMADSARALGCGVVAL
ncbi:MAG TPA: type II toxin-antitoxin system VapC family toxin [Caulobacter sp.]|nr:type II toxin-antitoxin system VapC family toxin [Caulobacter sp.]